MVFSLSLKSLPSLQEELFQLCSFQNFLGLSVGYRVEAFLSAFPLLHRGCSVPICPSLQGKGKALTSLAEGPIEGWHRTDTSSGSLSVISRLLLLLVFFFFFLSTTCRLLSEVDAGCQLFLDCFVIIRPPPQQSVE